MSYHEEIYRCNIADTYSSIMVLPRANLVAHSEPGTPISYSRLALPRLVSEIFASDTQTYRGTDNTYRYYSCPHYGGPTNELSDVSSCRQCVQQDGSGGAEVEHPTRFRYILMTSTFYLFNYVFVYVFIEHPTRSGRGVDPGLIRG